MRVVKENSLGIYNTIKLILVFFCVENYIIF